MQAADTDRETDARDLAAMDDPALIAHWAAVRSQLALTSRGSRRRGEIKAAYDAALAEYRRRLTTEAAL
jgi:hypothetical protein